MDHLIVRCTNCDYARQCPDGPGPSPPDAVLAHLVDEPAHIMNWGAEQAEARALSAEEAISAKGFRRGWDARMNLLRKNAGAAAKAFLSAIGAGEPS